MPDITIDGTSISGVTIDGTQVQEVTIDGNVVWTAKTVYFDDDFSSFDSGTWTLQHSAKHTGSDIELVPNTADEEGQLIWDSTHSSKFRCTYDYINSGSSTSGFFKFIFWADGTDDTGQYDGSTVSNALKVSAPPDRDKLKIQKLEGGSGTTIASSAFTIDNDTFNIEAEADPSQDKIWAKITDSNGNSTTVSTTDSFVSTAANNYTNFFWEGAHWNDSSAKDVDNAYMDNEPQNI